MKKVRFIVFRYLTSADLFNIYKHPKTEVGGGGQSYIDFPTQMVPIDYWGKFFENAASVICSSGRQGPVWEFPVHSIGVGTERELTIYQRRQQSVCIASQKITSQQENRVDAWRPEHGFPEPDDPDDREVDPEGLLIFIVRTHDGEFWAGWSRHNMPVKNEQTAQVFARSSGGHNEPGYAGFIQPQNELFLDTNDKQHPFTV